MDINAAAALARLIQAALAGDGTEVVVAANDVASWLDADGFPPTIGALLIELGNNLVAGKR